MCVVVGGGSGGWGSFRSKRFVVIRPIFNVGRFGTESSKVCLFIL